MNRAAQIDILALALSTMDTPTRNQILQKALQRKCENIPVSSIFSNLSNEKLV